MGEYFRRRSGWRRPCPKASPGVSATSVGGYRSRDQAQHGLPAGDGGRLTANHLEPPKMSSQERVPGRNAAGWRRSLRAIGSRQGPSDPPQSSHHHGRRCVPRPVWARQAVASVAVQVGQSSSPRHISPSEKRQPFSRCIVLPAPVRSGTRQPALLVAASRLVAPRRHQAARTYATYLFDYTLFTEHIAARKCVWQLKIAFF